MSNTGDRRAPVEMYRKYNFKPHYRFNFKQEQKGGIESIDESEDIQSGDHRAEISHYRTYAEKSLRGDDESLDEASEDIVALENPEAWKIWKNMLLTNQPKMQEFGGQMAVYMHCMLQ